MKTSRHYNLEMGDSELDGIDSLIQRTLLQISEADRKLALKNRNEVVSNYLEGDSSLSLRLKMVAYDAS